MIGVTIDKRVYVAVPSNSMSWCRRRIEGRRGAEGDPEMNPFSSHVVLA